MTIKDEGVGIAETDLARLFRPFQQAEQRSNRKYGGTGLGLSIVRDLLELMGGQVTVKSTLAKGSEFFVRLPFRPNPPTQISFEANTNKVFAFADNQTLRTVIEPNMSAPVLSNIQQFEKIDELCDVLQNTRGIPYVIVSLGDMIATNSQFENSFHPIHRSSLSASLRVLQIVKVLLSQTHT